MKYIIACIVMFTWLAFVVDYDHRKQKEMINSDRLRAREMNRKAAMHADYWAKTGKKLPVDSFLTNDMYRVRPESGTNK